MSLTTSWASARTRARFAGRPGRREGEGRNDLLEVFDDEHRLREDAPVVFQRGHDPLRIDPQVLSRPELLRPWSAADEDRFVVDALEVERDANRVGGARLMEGVELYVFLWKACGSGRPKGKWLALPPRVFASGDGEGQY